MSKSLFKEFDPVSSKEWKQKIQADLRGADYNETLIWQSPEGIDVKPFYHRDDFNTPFPAVPGHPGSWKIVQQVFVDAEDIANSIARNALEKGADALWIKADKEFELSEFLKDIDTASASFYFDLNFLSETFNTSISKYFQKHTDGVYINTDIISHLAEDGNWYHSKAEDHRIIENLVKHGQGLAVNGHLYQNAGANTIQELAYSLAQATEYLQHFQDFKELKITFVMAVGSNYFTEIAKFRALRMLFATVAEEFGIDTSCHILAVPSFRNKTLYDYNVNLLRTTTECMSAITGGADAICNLPYDAVYHKSNEFGERIARNQLLILRSESYFDQVANPADGSYYIESLTQQLATKALELFKAIENSGGFVKQLFDGTIKRKIKESAEKEQKLFDEKQKVLVGTNEFVNEDDRMKNDLQLYPFLKVKPRKTLFEPIKSRRISEKLEKERLKNEEN